MKQTELKLLIERAIEKERSFCASLIGESNPIIVSEIQQASGRLAAFESVLDAINGNQVMLKIWAKGF
jgi:hypothetical protein